ncbi:MAG TPA: hypothetical protein VM470_04765 [Acidimicrobiia bacterium]|nr:hypothetical protein [Acidimicrobiia bacterium]
MWTSSVLSPNHIPRSGAASYRRRVRQLPLLAATIDLGPLLIDLDPLDLLEDLEPGLASQLRAEQETLQPLPA